MIVESAYADMRATSRFWARVVRIDDVDSHWLYVGGTNDDGYGIFHYRGRKVYAHRFAWTVQHGPIPPALRLCHECDVRLCVRHLFLGTQADNMQDLSLKRRARHHRVEIIPLRALGPKRRTERNQLIREMAATSYSHRFIAEQFGLAKGTVGRILSAS